MGIGHPQYLCLEIPQSRRRNCILFLPAPKASNFSVIEFLASSLERLLNSLELIRLPVPIKALVPSYSFDLITC